MAEATNMSYLYTIGGYATLFGLGYAVYHVSTQKDRKRAPAPQAKAPKPSQSESRKEDRKKKQRMESFTSEGSSQKGSKVKASGKATEPSPFLSNVQANDTSDDGVDNREFAKQLSKAKQGTSFATNSDSGKKQKEKSVKQSRASQIGAPANKTVPPPSAPSSGDGADADDDQSPVHSPATEPAAESTDASGVADMLEPTPSGPSVLRLTDTGSKDKNKKKKPTKALEPVETKKQRQNRKKAEAAKAAREEAEKDRRVLEEKQRRAARIAEGRPAKDGSQFTTASVKNSAWNQGAPNGGQAQSPGANEAQQLLDTFDAPVAAKPPKPSPPSQTESAWISSLPSEEEQLEMLKSEADEWSTVKTKSSKKSGKKDTPAGSGDDAPAHTRAAPQPKQPSPAVTTSNPAKSSQNFGSFSALTVKGGSEEEVEEEWDV